VTGVKQATKTVMETNREERIDLRDYMRVIVKRRWTIISIFALVVLAAAVYTFSAIPIYQATARIVIEKENPNLVSIQEVMAVDATGSDYYQTQYKIIESRAVAREVVQRLNLQNTPEFFPEPGDDVISNIKAWVNTTLTSWKDWINALIKTGPAPADPEAYELSPDFKLVNAFIDRVKVEPIRNSRLVDIRVAAMDPKMAARMANELVRAYIDQNLESKLAAAKDAVQWLGDRIQEERRKVEAAEGALLTYKEKFQIITDFSSDAEKITAQKLAQLNSQVVDAESARVEAETRYKQAMALDDTPDMLDSIPEVLKNELVQEIKKMEVNLYNRMSELSKKYGKRHPQMLAIESELEDLQKRKVQEVKRVINSLRNQFRLAVAKEESLKKALEKQKNESLEMNKKAVQYGVLQRQAESARQMYEMLIKRFKETSLTEEMKTGNIRVVDRAETPIHPVKPRKKLNLLLALVVGLTLGIGLAFFLEYLDNTIKLPDEVRDYLKIPYLGPIPAYAKDGSRDGFSGDLVALHAPKSTASESFRGIRTGVLFSSADKSPQVILVSSSGPGEGKTVCASNLAVTMAQAGTRVVLLDCDMRRPRQHKLFNISREVGVSNVLVGSNTLAEALVADVIPNLDVIPCGPIPPNPSEIIGSNKMKDLIAALRKDYARIIIDSPPVTAVTDSVVLAQAADGVIMVIRAGDTPRQIVLGGIFHLKALNAPILGAILNGVRTGKDSYYYYQYYYYYYGEDGDRRKRFKSE